MKNIKQYRIVSLCSVFLWCCGAPLPSTITPSAIEAAPAPHTQAQEKFETSVEPERPHIPEKTGQPEKNIDTSHKTTRVQTQCADLVPLGTEEIKASKHDHSEPLNIKGNASLRWISDIPKDSKLGHPGQVRACGIAKSIALEKTEANESFSTWRIELSEFGFSPPNPARYAHLRRRELSIEQRRRHETIPIPPPVPYPGIDDAIFLVTLPSGLKIPFKEDQIVQVTSIEQRQGSSMHRSGWISDGQGQVMLSFDGETKHNTQLGSVLSSRRGESAGWARARTHTILVTIHGKTAHIPSSQWRKLNTSQGSFAVRAFAETWGKGTRPKDAGDVVTTTVVRLPRQAK